MKKNGHLEAVTINKKSRLISKGDFERNWTGILYSG
jgi:hypothetical protein